MGEPYAKYLAHAMYLANNLGNGLAKLLRYAPAVTDPDPHAELRAAGDTFKAARAELQAAKDRLDPLVLAALKSGEPNQAQLAQITGYTRENLRLTARKHGIDAR